MSELTSHEKLIAGLYAPVTNLNAKGHGILPGMHGFDQFLLFQAIKKDWLAHQPELLAIYCAIAKLYDKNIRPEILTVVKQLMVDKNEKNAIAVSPAFVTGLVNGVDLYTITSVNYLLADVSQQHTTKIASLVSLELVQGLNTGMEPLPLIESAALNLTLLIQQQPVHANTIQIDQVIDKELGDYEKRKARRELGSISGIPSGLQCFDDACGGWQPEVYVLAARPGMGKTATALFHAKKAAQKGYKAVFVNTEMQDIKLGQRLILSEDEYLDSTKLREGSFSDKEYARYVAALTAISELRNCLTLIDDANITVEQLCRVARILKSKGELDILFIDYLQLIGTEQKRDNRELEISYISRTIKKLQKELEIPVILLAQLSRNVEARSTKIPILSDLRESGAIEQDADNVIFIFRPEIYKLNKGDQTPYTNETFYYIEKYRNGAPTMLEFVASFNKANYRDKETPQYSAISPPQAAQSAIKPLQPNLSFDALLSNDDDMPF